jgi:O-antigen/teichoic acid export membrane protein
MVVCLRNALKYTVTAIWPLLFGQPVSEHIIAHVERFLLLGTALAISKIVSMTTQIFLGRQLGAARYGDVSIVLLLASYFSLPMASGWGLAFIRKASTEASTKAKLQALKAVLAVAGVASALTIMILLVFRNSIAAALKLDHPMMTMTIAMTVGYAWWNLSKQIAQAFQNWRIFTCIDIGSSVITLSGSLIVISWHGAGLLPVCTVFLIGYFFSGLAQYARVRAAIGERVFRPHIRTTLSHGIFLLFSGLVGMAAFCIDRFLIFRFLGSQEVGIYQAHFLATYGIGSSLTTVVITYLFPIFCQDHQNVMFTGLKRFEKRQYPFTIALSVLFGIIVMFLYKYPIENSLFVCLCLFAGLQINIQIKSYYLAGKGTHATRHTLIAQILFLVFNVATLTATIKRFGILAGGLSLVTASMAAIIYLSKVEREIIRERAV